MKQTLYRRRILPLLLSLLLLTAGCDASIPAQTTQDSTTTVDAPGSITGAVTTEADVTESITDAVTTAPPEGTAPSESTDAETTDAAEAYPDPDAQYTVSVVNGTIDGTDTGGTYKAGTPIALCAEKPVKGYGFSHWEDGDGNRVGEAEEVTVTVIKNTVYKAYYTVVFGDNSLVGTPVMTNFATEWQQGGINGDLKVFNTSDKSRISFAEPLFLRKGEVLTVTIPNDPWSCPFAENASKVPCEDGCTIAVAKMILKKNEGSDTGDLFTDYSLTEKANWNMGGFRYEATEDVYVMITVKYDKHGGLPFHTEKAILRDMQIIRATAEEVAAYTPVGSYWEAELEDAVGKIEKNRATLGDGVSEFFFITDVHWKDYNAQYSPALISYLAERLDTYQVILGGDIIERNATREGAINEEVLPFFYAMSGYTEAGERLKIFSTLGNHDRNYLSYKPNTSYGLTDEDVYSLYIARTEGWAVSPTGNPYCSYYDDTVNKVRYLQFAYASDTVDLAGDRFAETLTWVGEQITALEGDWTVVLITHGVFEEKQNKWAATVKSRVLSWQKESDATIAVWITGHIHSDHSEILLSDDGSAFVRAISLNCDSYAKRGTNTAQMNYRTSTEQSFSFIQIDTKTQTIHLTRIGAGKDLTFAYGTAITGA